MREGDDKLISFLMREKHGSPFEHGHFQFRVEAPIFVAREHMRHRVGHSYNEVSGRYVELEPKFHLPTEWRRQVGKPGAYTYETIEDKELLAYLDNYAMGGYDRAWGTYLDLLERGVAKEQARIVLPVGTFTKYIWSCNPRSLMHFISLRSAPNAQAEIREVASQAEESLQRCLPQTHRAFVEYGRISP